MNILIADDDEDIRFVISEILRENLNDDLEIYEANDGLRALELANNAKFDLLVIDNQMPRISGLKLFKTLRQASANPNRSCPVIVLSGYINEFSAQMPPQEDFVWLCEKPPVEDKFMNVVRIALLAGKRGDVVA